MWKGYDDKIAKDICYNCGSTVSKQTYAYFRTALHYSPDKVWSEILDGKAFYVANRCRDHVRFIEMAVRSDCQGEGLGRKVLYRLLTRTKAAGLSKLTFRTPIAEHAVGFWLRVGATITGLKDNDYEMEINIR